MDNRIDPPRKKFVPYVTYIYIALCVLLYAFDFITAKLGYGYGDTGLASVLGMRVNSLITVGQWWRLLTPMLLHGGITHLLMNAWGLYVWGRTAEALFGRIRYTVILLVSGYTASLLGYAFSSYNALGASGAIFGLLGAYLAFGQNHKNLFKTAFGIQIPIYVAMNLVLGFLTEGIDNLGHIGGLAGGFLCGMVLIGPDRRPYELRTLLASAGIAVAVAAALFAGVYRLLPSGDGLFQVLLSYGVTPFGLVMIPWCLTTGIAAGSCFINLRTRSPRSGLRTAAAAGLILITGVLSLYAWAHGYAALVS